MEKVIITAAVTGSLTTREQNPNLPITPEEIAAAAVESRRAGAAVVHLHVRDPRTGRPVQDVELFKEVVGLIRAECDILINVSTGGGPGMSFDQRLAVVPALAAEKRFAPELASLNAGSVNFGIFSRKAKDFILDDVQLNPWSELKRFAQTLTELGVKPEIEIYEAGMIHNALVLEEMDVLKPPLHFQFVLGVMGGLQATVDNLVFLKNSIPAGATWSVCVVGPDIWPIGAAALACGGHVRVGLEDTAHIEPGVPAESNAQLVARLVDLAGLVGRSAASPQEARTILDL